MREEGHQPQQGEQCSREIFLQCCDISSLFESARGLAHSKTWRNLMRSVTRDSVLECAGPPALFGLHSNYPHA